MCKDWSVLVYMYYMPPTYLRVRAERDTIYPSAPCPRAPSCQRVRAKDSPSCSPTASLRVSASGPLKPPTRHRLSTEDPEDSLPGGEIRVGDGLD